METQKYNPEMLKLARQLAKLTQKEAAKLASLDVSLLSRLERGERPITDDAVAAIAKCVQRPIEFFEWSGELCAPSTIFHRRKATTRMRDVEYTNAYVNFVRLKVAKITSTIRLKSKRKLHRLELDGANRGANAARLLRASWQIPPGPIDNLAKIFDSAGIVVWKADNLPTDVDGLSLWPLGEEDTPPVVILVGGKSADRERLTMAHELGHLSLHHTPVDNYEREANQFAAEFLMPETDIKRHLRNLTLPKAAALKGTWRVSMQALIYRAHELGAISDSQYRRLCMDVNQKGYRRKEPVEISAEEPCLLKSLVKAYAESVDPLGLSSPAMGELNDRGTTPAPSQPRLRVVS